MTDVPAQAPEETVSSPILALDHLDDLEEVVTTGRRVPFSSGVLVNEETVLTLVDKLRSSLPETVVQSGSILRERQRIQHEAEREAQAIISRAEQDAERIVEAAHGDAEAIIARARADAETVLADARDDAARLIEEHEIARQARERARTLVDEATATCDEMRADADGYAREVMESLEEHLEKAMATVQKGIRALPESRRTGRRR